MRVKAGYIDRFKRAHSALSGALKSLELGEPSLAEADLDEAFECVKLLRYWLALRREAGQ